MEWIKKHKLFFIFFVLIVILTPFILHFLIFENTFPSKVSNDGWAGFFGGYIGAIIGAFATVIAITIEIEHNKKEKYDDHIMSMRPYLCVNVNGVSYSGGKVVATLTIQNLGLQAACGIQMLEFDQDDTENASVYNKRFSLAANGKTTIEVKIDLNKTEDYLFDFKDVGDNFYRQKISASCHEPYGFKSPEYFISFEPVLLQTKKEREEKFERIRIK